MRWFIPFLVVGRLFAATTFLEPGGDADGGVALWDSILTSPAAVTDFVHGSHIYSIKYRAAQDDEVRTAGKVVDAGGRWSFWAYFNVIPGGTATLAATTQSTIANNILRIRMTSTGQLQLWNNTVQIGSSGSTLTTGTWYRLCLTWNITSTSVNTINLYLNGTSNIAITNASLTYATSNMTRLGNISTSNQLDMRTSDHYIDNNSGGADPGNIWVTAKRPFSNGTTNGFTTQIGSGGSGYGSGHSPQVNERPLSTTNGWSMIGAGSAITEEYSIEGKSTGDIDISAGTIVDFVGWVSAKSLAGETASIIVAGNTSNISLTSTITIFIKVAGSSTYPAGLTDIGIITTTALTTVSLYEAGIMVAYTPGVSSCIPSLASLGAGTC
jgi:hypothetical protein